MIGSIDRKRQAKRTTLGRLRSDVGGNVLAMMAIALIPVCGLIGSGIDTARLYVVKARLQQACDAGALAGRKAMVTSASTTLDTNAANQARTFFNNNFVSGWMRTNTVNFTPTKTTDQQVAGTASANVPMTIMKMFGAPDVVLTVTCQARYDVADTDIMFVLDTTGSMADKPDNSGGGGTYAYTRENGTSAWATAEASSGSKISALRTSVVNFYDTVAASADSSTHIRYGFVPYSVSANVGQAIASLDPSYLVNSWNYNTRVPAGEANDTVYSSSSTSSTTTQTACPVGVVRTPATGYTEAGSGTSATATAILKTTSWASNKCTVLTQNMKVTWIYKNAALDVSQIKAFGAVDDPTRFGNSKVTWIGCIEERQTTFGTTSFNIASLPPDLDPDLTPSSDATRWKPALPQLTYYRGNNTTWSNSGPSGSASSDSTATGTSAGAWAPNSGNSDNTACPKAAKRLSVMSRQDVLDYVSASGDLRPAGTTYHDAGMIWGTRLLAPNGPFGADTAAWPGRNDPNRYIVFMTDGTMNSDWNTYGLYGLEYYDKRISGINNDESYHNARFLAECSAAKARGITVFTIAFGQAKTSQLTSCASPGQDFQASDNAALDAAFQNIAKQIALLRISQ